MYPNKPRHVSGRKKILVALIILLVTGGVVFFAATLSSTDKPELATDSTEKTSQNSSEAEQKQGAAIPQNPPDGVSVSNNDYRLLTENERFKIRTDGNKYLITLYAIINRPDQRDLYIDQLRSYKKEALDYLKNNGYDVTTSQVNYEPEEAQDL